MAKDDLFGMSGGPLTKSLHSCGENAEYQKNANNLATSEEIIIEKIARTNAPDISNDATT